MGNVRSNWGLYMVIIPIYMYNCIICIIIYYILVYLYYRRKFRSQTSDNMDRWEKQRWEKSEKEKEPEERNAAARKGRKAAIHCNDLWLQRVEK